MTARLGYRRYFAAAGEAFAGRGLTLLPALMLGFLGFMQGFVACATARASVAVLVEQPYGRLGRFDPAGHSAIYFDHICAASPTQLRACRPDEPGSVVSRYDGIDGYDWLAMPVVAYLYAVDSMDEVPQTMNKEREQAFRDSYRREHLEALAPDLPDGSAPKGNWYELVGSAYDRTIYGFSVRSTPQQDAALIELFNDRKNVQRYNGLFINCADFARVTINRFYPHAVRRNFIADFGMTSPKSVARALAHYARKHPKAGLTTFIVPQVAGTLPRSHEAVDLSEGILKKYSIPIAIFSPTTAAVVLVAYLGHGRFAMPKNAPVLDLNDPSPYNAAADKAVALATAEASSVAPPPPPLDAPPGLLLRPGARMPNMTAPTPVTEITVVSPARADAQ